MNQLILRKGIDQLSIIEIVDHLLLEASKIGVSDIHLDPARDYFRVRFRLDGILEEALRLPKELSPPVISRLKVLSGLRTDEHQRPQDGRFSFQMSGELIDVRISIVPTYYGENAVLRLLSKSKETQELSKLGFNSESVKAITESIKKSSGMILVTGPTGSGKTTTLYTILEMLKNQCSSIVTIEDPIEYAIDGLEQIQVREHSALSFANGLRAVLRQDPDIVMVGEIRDRETAGIAINSALTGHLLLSTLHTNDSATAIVRLFDMGIEPYLIASTASLVIAQRLVRRVSPAGGFKGRMVISEILKIDEKIKEAILRRSSQAEIKKVAMNQGMITMKEDGFEKSAAGLTEISEVMRVIHD